MKFKDDVILVKFLKPLVNPNIMIYKIESFRDWRDKMNYQIYTGPNYIMVNTTSNCTKFIDEPKKFRVTDTCLTSGRSLNFNEGQLWKSITLTRDSVLEETVPAY